MDSRFAEDGRALPSLRKKEASHEDLQRWSEGAERLLLEPEGVGGRDGIGRPPRSGLRGRREHPAGGQDDSFVHVPLPVLFVVAPVRLFAIFLPIIGFAMTFYGGGSALRAGGRALDHAVTSARGRTTSPSIWSGASLSL